MIKSKLIYPRLIFGLITYATLYFFATVSFASEVKMIRLSEASVAKVFISTRGTVLSFPTKPSKVILGRANSFGIEYVENDLAISPLSLSARSNLFVYFFGRRFAFDLIATPESGTSVIQVRDALEIKPKDGKK
ncbi:MAG: hypothetical protein A4S09_03330 [Proteobacteria bacterium SG_bin7]|nr:MAG: hypothetical protein A4S09_03330 [Proteobacteria bacterium SG_bin7]